MTQEKFQQLTERYFQKMQSTIIGQNELCHFLLIAYIASGHVLLEGAPGLAKTLAVKTFSQAVSLSFKRIQFTPDLLPADLIGTLIFQQGVGKFAVRKGPIFANILLADEINRAPAKVQSALLEAMAERQVTIGENSYSLPEPFFVLATQNPIEQDGTYALPEAELDRFLMKLSIDYPSHADEVKIVKKIAGEQLTPVQNDVSDKEPQENAAAIFSVEDLYQMRNFCNAVSMDDSLTDYIVSIVEATRPAKPANSNDFLDGSYLNYLTIGASPRASIAFQICAKIEAALSNRSYVIPDDIKKIAYPILRHRLKLSYEAIAENLTADAIIEKILNIVPQP